MNQRLQLSLVALLAAMLVLFLCNTNVAASRNRNRNLTTSSESPSTQDVGAIHVGKCGGVGLRQALRHPRTKTILKPTKVQWFHMGSVDPRQYKNWIVLIRDPVARIKSNYIFEHVANAHLRTDAAVAIPQSHLPTKKMLYECYNTLQKLVTIGLAPSPPPPDRIAQYGIPGKAAPGSEECRRLAFGLFDGPGENVVMGMSHFSFNYEYYLRKLLAAQRDDPAMKIWVARQEHMQDDVDKIDRAMGGNGVEWHMKHFEHVRSEDAKRQSKDAPDREQQLTKYMSPDGLRNLCRVLCVEIQYYKMLVERAEQNFMNGAASDNTFVEETLAPLKEQCPEEVQATECEPVVPPSLKAANRAATYKEFLARKEASSKATTE